MIYRDFHGEKISQLGFGMMRLPVIDGDQAKIDYDKVEEMFLYAYENGINYYDTAFPYHSGQSEVVVGKLLQNNHLRDKVNVATKLFTMGCDKPDFNPQAILDEQLRRLQTDHIDFYLLHGLRGAQWDVLKEKHDIVNFMRRLKDEGIVRHMGFSFHDSYDSFVHIMDDFDWEFAQIQYNYMDNEIQAGDAGMAYALKKGVALSIMEPLKGGSLIFPSYQKVEDIKASHGLADMSNAELGLSYVLNKPGLLTVLSGMGAMEQVKENIAIASRCTEGGFSDEAKAAVAEIRNLVNSTENIPCTGCRYCCDGCPMQIAIPTAFHLYNEGKKYQNPAAQKRNYDRSCANLDTCVECGQCMEACPQHLEIPTLLKEVRAYLG